MNKVPLVTMPMNIEHMAVKLHMRAQMELKQNYVM